MATKISLCMIVRDEEQLLPGCLDSVRDCVDEIVVGDTGSRDRTVEIARSSGARVLEIDWDDDFSAARNRTLEAANGDWILVLDADEELEPAAGKRLIEAASDEQYLAYNLPVSSTIGGGKKVEGVLLRFFRNLPGIRFRNCVHEQIHDAAVECCEERNQRIGYLEATIRHHGYEPDRFEQRRKKERNGRLLRKQCRLTPEDLYSHHKLARHLEETEGRSDAWREAVLRSHEILQDPVHTERHRKRIYAAEVCTDYGLVLEADGRLQEADRHLAGMAESLLPTVNLLYNRGRFALALGRVDEAIAFFRATLDHDPGEVTPRLGVQGHLGHHALAVALHARGCDEEAVRAVEKALQDDPDYAPSRRLLEEISGNVSEATARNETPATRTENTVVNDAQRNPERPEELWSIDPAPEIQTSILQWHAVFMPFFDSCSRILDVGCGNGLFLELVRAAKKQGLGLDRSQDSVQRVQSRGLDAREWDLRNGLPEGDFDGIHACHVLEALDQEQLSGFLAACDRMLPPNGVLVLRLLNLENPDVRDRIFWQNKDHVRPYPLDVLEGELAKAGFQVRQKGTEKGNTEDLFVVAEKAGAPSTTGTPTTATTGGHAPRLVWEGSQFVSHSLARVNRELTLALLDAGSCETSIMPYEPHTFGPEVDPDRFSRIQSRLHAPLSGSADVHVRHQWPPNFNRPPAGKWVTYQPWEYGAIPATWLAPLRDQVDEVWVPSESVRSGMIESGVPGEKIHVIPNAVNPDQFRPEAPPLPLPGEGTYRFLFVGGTIWRKGADRLLDAYLEAFAGRDDVTLIIKEFGQDSCYKNQVMDRRIREHADSGKTPRVVYLEEHYSEADLPGLYTACDCLVHPFRGEGFALPVAEAAACGLPVIVTDGGPCNEYLDETMAYFIPSVRTACNIDLDLARPGWILEPDAAALAELLRHVKDHSAEAAAKGAAASQHVRTNVTWARSAERVLERVGAGTPVAQTPPTSQATEPPLPAYEESGTPNESSDEIIQRLEQSLQELHRQADSPADREAFPEIDRVISEGHRALGRLYYENMKYAAARRELRQTLELDPSQASDWMTLGNAELLDGDTMAAIKSFEEAIRREPDNAVAFYNQGLALRCNNEIDRAAACFEKAIALGERSAELYNNLGVTFFELGKADQARHNLLEALKQDPGSIDASLNLARLEQEQGNAEAALERLLRAAAQNPGNEEIEAEIQMIRGEGESLA